MYAYVCGKAYVSLDSMEDEESESKMNDSESPTKKPKLQNDHKVFGENAILHLISLQKANGSWELDEELTKILGTSLEDMKEANPAKKKKAVPLPRDYKHKLPQTRTVNMEQQCGLITGDMEPVPLKNISVNLCINDFVAGVSATLNYENEEEVPVEAIFVFPMDEDSAVYSFEALVDGKKIVAELQEKMQVSLAEGHKFDRDVELLIYYSEVHSPSVAVEMGMQDMKPDSLMGSPSAMVSFYPDLPEVEGSRACGEFIFLMDRSGSMGSRLSHHNDSQLRIEAAKETLLLLLKSLPMGCYFNIYGFGSSYEKFFPESVKYTQETMEEAVKRVKDLKADLGGTEILTPLLNIYKGPSIPEHPLQLFVFTDGEVDDTFSVIKEVKLNSKKHRYEESFGENAILHLISLQKANGSWELDEELTEILGTSLEDIKAANPAKDQDPSVWATVLAVLWLHANGKDLKCEWELLERKAVAWLHDHADSSNPMLVQAANSFLKLSVTPDDLVF
ncbi:hypothetical protein NN561_014598 [Cricetulus griseus]